MKNLSKCSVAKLFLLFTFIIGAQLHAQEVSLKLYGIKSGIIEYKYSGTQVGTSTLYFDQYGYRSAMNMDTKGEDEIFKGWIISHKEYQYIFDPSKPDEGLKMKNPVIESLIKMDKQDYDKVKEGRLINRRLIHRNRRFFLRDFI